MSNRAYNLTMTATEISTKTDSAGKNFIKAKVGLTIRGRETTRTLIAQGKAMEAIKDTLVVGSEVKIRCLFSNADNDDGSKGGEYLTAIGLPREQAA